MTASWTLLLEDSIQIRGYTSSPVLIQNEPLANLFHECKVILQSTEAEAICLNEMQKDSPAKEEDMQPISLLQVSMEQLLQLLDTTSKYIDEVVDGTHVLQMRLLVVRLRMCSRKCLASSRLFSKRYSMKICKICSW